MDEIWCGVKCIRGFQMEKLKQRITPFCFKRSGDSVLNKLLSALSVMVNFVGQSVIGVSSLTVHTHF
ncbi:hypothetical protein DYD21_05090 [Rhodohalobacter sp. SW132]|nr:hypothetical protein DYD21_05090 [Rhodohalobacter sp. SW132]